MREQQVLWYYYWHRLAGCALAWFFWDVSFYGNKLFQSTFIKILYPGASILTTLEWTLLNSSVSLVCALEPTVPPCECMEARHASISATLKSHAILGSVLKCLSF